MKMRIFIRQVTGNSMLPALKPGSILFFTRRYELKAGDIVIFKRDNLEIVKRIHAIKNNEVFLLGDNPNESTDSRHWGWLQINEIFGKKL